MAPKLLDIYLGRTGVKSQQTAEQLPRWHENLSTARDTDEDRGAHGPFDARAHTRDPVLWCSMHRRALLAGLAAVILGGATAAGDHRVAKYMGYLFGRPR
jgi:hypothetical protein